MKYYYFKRLQLILATVLLIVFSTKWGLGETRAKTLELTDQGVQQNIEVKGTVSDAEGPLPGVSVTVKNQTGLGISTNQQGNYMLKVPADAILVFRMLGYVSQEVALNGRTTVDIKLLDEMNTLEEAVVIGYGTQKKKDLTGAVSSVSEKQIAERQPVTLFDALQGQTAGVMVTNDNGDPAGQGTIQIRGASTINATGTGPLYVIDGIISENANFLNPADIATIDILKDGSSTAIYGARGANGVILITTKKGKEGRPTINVNYTHTIGNLAHKLRTTSADELRYYRSIRDNNNGTNPDSINPYLNADNDYQDLLFKTAHKQVANLSIGGGKKGITYYGGISYTDDRSIVLNSWIKRLQSKINMDYEASDRFKVSNSLAYAYQTGNIINVGNTAKQVFEKNPWTGIYRPDGSLAGYIESKRNPVAQALFNKNVDQNFSIQYNNRLNYRIIQGLEFTTLFNAQLDNNTNEQLTPASLSNNSYATGSNSFEKRFYWEAQGFLNYNKIFGKDHEVSGLLGLSADRRKRNNYLISMQEYLSEAINTSNAGIIDLTKTRTTATANSNASIFGRVNYSYKGTYLAQATIRRDGSSRFGADNKWGTFISGALAWRFSDEKFMDWAKQVLADGKIRYSYGQAGNDAIGDYASYTVLNFGDDYYNGFSAAAENTTLGNSSIQWETTTSHNIGLDLSFLKGRLTFTGEYYTKITDNLLYGSELAKESGKSQVTINLGKIENTGLEFMLGGTVIQKPDFSWDVNANISFQRGTIKELANHTSFISGNKWLIEEGGKIGNFYLWKNLGVYQYNASNAYAADGTQLTPVNVSADGKTADYLLNGQSYDGTIYRKSRNGVVLEGGDTEWFDVNNDNVIDDQDKVLAGNGIPDYYFGFSNTFQYKNFMLSFIFNGQVGNKVYNSVANGQNQNSSTYSPPTWEAATTAWAQQGDISKYPLASRKDTRGSMSNGYNSLYLEDGSFIRLSSVKFTYDLNPEVAQKMKMKRASIFFFAQNLSTWTNYSWYDPEFSTSNQLQPGDDTGKYPKRREYGLGVNLNF